MKVLDSYPQKTTSSWNNWSINSSCWPAQEVCWWFLTCCFLHPERLPCSSCLLVEDMLQSALYFAPPLTPPHENTHTFQYQITKDGTISLTQLTTTDMRDRLGDALDNGECHSLVRSTASGYSHRAGSKYLWPQRKYKFGGSVYV